MKNSKNIKIALYNAIKSALNEFVDEHGKEALKELDWFNYKSMSDDEYKEALAS